MEASSKQQNIYPNIPKAPIAIPIIAGSTKMPEPITIFTIDNARPCTPITRFKPSSEVEIGMDVNYNYL